MNVWHFQAEEDPVELLLIDYVRGLLTITERADLGVERSEHLGHQFQAGNVILYNKEFQRRHASIQF